MHIVITHVYPCSKTGYTVRKMALSITCQDRQTQSQGLAADAMAPP